MNRIKELRKDNNLTQTQLGEEIGVSKRTIVAWENNQRVINPNKAQQLADYFAVSVPYLMGYDSNEKVIADLKEKLVDAVKEIKQYRLLKVGLDDYIAEKDVLDVIDEIFD